MYISGDGSIAVCTPTHRRMGGGAGVLSESQTAGGPKNTTCPGGGLVMGSRPRLSESSVWGQTFHRIILSSFLSSLGHLIKTFISSNVSPKSSFLSLSEMKR